MKVTKYIFRILFEEVVKECNKRVRELDIAHELPDGRGPAFFGFKQYADAENSIKGIILKDTNVKSYLLKEAQRIKKIDPEKISDQDLAKFVNGKSLYNKYLEAGKDNSNFIQLKGIYKYIYAIFLGFQTLDDFISSKSGLVDFEVKRQNALAQVGGNELTNLALKFVGYYFNYHDNLIKRFILEIDCLNNYLCRQSGFHFVPQGAEKNDELPDSDNIDLDKDKVFIGNAVDQSGVLFLNLKNIVGHKGKHSHMGIFLNVGGMRVQEMEFIRGTLTTKSVYGYLMSTEIYLRKVIEKIPNEKIFQIGYKEDDETSTAIKRYLILQRRTFRVPKTTPQKIDKLFIKNHPPNIISTLVGNWLIWGLDRQGAVLQSLLIINNDYTAILKTKSIHEDEEQVCIFRIAKGTKSYHLWISAHEEDGIELRNIAVVQIPDQEKNNPDITIGCSMGLGIKSNKYAFTPIVLMRLRKSVEIEDVSISAFVESTLRGLLSPEGENLPGIDNNSMYEEFEKLFDIYLKRKFFRRSELKKDARYEKK